MNSIAKWRRLLNTLLETRMDLLAAVLEVARAMAEGRYAAAQDLLDDLIAPLRGDCAALDKAAREATLQRYARA